MSLISYFKYGNYEQIYAPKKSKAFTASVFLLPNIAQSSEGRQ